MARYKAFISYTHGSEMPLATALDEALTRFAKPWNRLRAMRIYRDVDSQPLTPNLLSAVEGAMEDSEYLILLASPSSAASPWVPREVEHWVKYRPVENLLIVVCDGEIEWDHEAGDFDWDKTNCLPHTLKGVYQGSPLYLDMRWSKGQEGLSLDHPQFKDNVARLSATVNGMSKEDMLSEEVAQFRRTARIRNAAIATLSVLLVATVVAAIVAVHQRNEAIKASLRIQVQSELDNNRLGKAVQTARAARDRFGDDESVRDMGWQLVSHPTAVVNEFKDLNAHFARFSPDGTRLLTGLYKKNDLLDIRVHDRLGGNEHRINNLFANIGSATFFGDGSKLLLLNLIERETITVNVETTDGKVVERSCNVPSARVYDFENGTAVKYEGDWFGHQAHVCFDDVVRLFDSDGQHLRDIWAPNALSAVASASGQRILVDTEESGVMVMDNAGHVLARLPGTYPVFSPDESLIATVTLDFIGYLEEMCTLETTVLDYEGPFGEPPPELIEEETCEPPELGEKLALRGNTQVFTASGEPVLRLPGTHPQFAFGGIVTLKDVEVFGNWEKHPYWYELESDENIRKEIKLQGFDVVLSPDGNWIASGSRLRKETWIWHRSGRFHAKVDGGMPAWVPGQPMLMTNLWGHARIWNLERLRFGSRAVVADVIGVPPEAMGVPPEVMDFEDDEAFWAGCDPGCGPDFKYMDAIDQIETAQFEDPSCDPQSVSYQGHLMLSVCAADGSWRMYDLEAEKPDAAIMTAEHGLGLQKVGFSPDGNLVISIDKNGLARLWDISSGTAINTQIELSLGAEAHAYAFSPNSQMVAMTPYRGEARMWNTQGTLLASLRLQDSREEFRGLRFFNDGKHLVFAGTDAGHVDFYTLWTTDLDALYQEFNWVPMLPANALTQ